MSKPELSLPQKWREVVERQRSSGTSLAVFCRRNGVAVSSFYAWKRRIAVCPAAPDFIEAKVVASLPASRSTSVIEVRLRGGRRVRVSRGGFDRDLLAEVVAALEGLS